MREEKHSYNAPLCWSLAECSTSFKETLKSEKGKIHVGMDMFLIFHVLYFKIYLMDYELYPDNT